MLCFRFLGGAVGVSRWGLPFLFVGLFVSLFVTGGSIDCLDCCTFNAIDDPPRLVNT